MYLFSEVGFDFFAASSLLQCQGLALPKELPLQENVAASFHRFDHTPEFCKGL